MSHPLDLITDCLRHHMDILITEHRATGMTLCQVSRPGDVETMISAESLKDYPAEAIKTACEDALDQTEET